MDILGFGNFVESNDLSIVQGKLNFVLGSVLPMVLTLGVFPSSSEHKQLFDTTIATQKLKVWSFSDTFVLVSEDDSDESFFQIIAGSFICARWLAAIHP